MIPYIAFMVGISFRFQLLRSEAQEYVPQDSFSSDIEHPL